MPTKDTCLSVALHGPDGRTLYLATTTDTDPLRSVAPRSGRIESVTVAVGAPAS